MKKVEVNLYEYTDLSPEAQQIALENNRYKAVEFWDWWNPTYEDAKQINLIITGFDLDNGIITGKFWKGGYNTAELIIKSHGIETDTHKHASAFFEEYKKIDENDADGLEEYENQFLKTILKDYLKILKNDFEYLTSDEKITEEFNAYDNFFFADGTNADFLLKYDTQP